MSRGLTREALRWFWDALTDPDEGWSLVLCVALWIALLEGLVLLLGALHIL